MAAEHRAAVATRSDGEVVLVAVCGGNGKDDGGTKAVRVGHAGRLEALAPAGGALVDSSVSALQQGLQRHGPFAKVETFCALLGCVVLDRPYFLVATRTEALAALPFGHEVLGVRGTRWVAAPVPGVPVLDPSRKDRGRIEHLLATAFDEGGYYYCDRPNVRTLFPFEQDAGSDPFQSDWGAPYLRAAFDRCGAGPMCARLMRGFALGRVLRAPLPTATSGTVEGPVYVHMMGRQCHRNPAPRFFGRGLNEVGACGNDHVYDVVVWFYADPPMNTLVRYARHVYTRGTLPLRFRSVLRPVGEAPIVIGDDIKEGSVAYLTAAAATVADMMHAADISVGPTPSEPTTPEPPKEPQPPPAFVTPAAEAEAEVADSAGDDTTLDMTQSPLGSTMSLSDAGSDALGDARVPAEGPGGRLRMRCVNLLREVSSVGEDKLTGHFASAVADAEAALRQDPAAAGLALDFATVDFLGLQKAEGTAGAVSALWQHTLHFLDNNEPFSTGCATAAGPVMSPPECTGGLPDAVQRCVLRLNCADSLDRTNVAAFFCVTQLCVKMLYGLGVSPPSISDTDAFRPSGLATPAKATPPPASFMSPTPDAAPGLEETTTGGRFQPLECSADLPPCYYQTLDDLALECPAPLLRALVEIFVANGDTVAQLFTSTGALHTSVMRRLVPGMGEAPNNTLISAQRRYENTFRDKKRRRVLDALLGRRLACHFPTVHGAYSACPLPQQQWSSAVVLRLPATHTAATADAVRADLAAHWAAVQKGEGFTFAHETLPSSMPVHLGVYAEDGPGPATPLTPGLEAAASPDDVVAAGTEVPTVGSGEDLRLVVAVLPSADCARELLLRRTVALRRPCGADAVDVAVEPYEYAVEDPEEAGLGRQQSSFIRGVKKIFGK